jgi:hypothetical protein
MYHETFLRIQDSLSQKITEFLPAAVGHDLKFCLRTAIIFWYEVTMFVLCTHVTAQFLEHPAIRWSRSYVVY